MTGPYNPSPTLCATLMQRIWNRRIKTVPGVLSIRRLVVLLCLSGLLAGPGQIAIGQEVAPGEDVSPVEPVTPDETLTIGDESPRAVPNVIIIFVDDLGYADIGAFGATGYETPRLDQMAADGRIFTDFVASTAVCSASRAALLTGCYHRRFGLSGALFPDSTTGIPPGETTIGELCQAQGYKTACFGKWHLGTASVGFLPLQQGFDFYYGLPYSNDMWPQHPDYVDLPQEIAERKRRFPDLPLYDGNRIVNFQVSGEDQALLTKQYTERAVKFIDDYADRPFLLYLPHSMVHVPLFASNRFAGKSRAGVFGDVMMEIDWSTGRIIDAVKRNGIARNTLIVFTSDNGPWLSYGDHAGSAAPLREGKGTMWEGGYRVPTIMQWEGVIPAGTQCDELCSTIDFFPTIAGMIGGQLPDHKIDGKNILPLMTGDAPSPHEAFYCYYLNGQLQAVRDRRWKLVLPHKYRTLSSGGGSGGAPSNYKQVMAEEALYDLKSDVGETRNVAAENPIVVRRLKNHVADARADLGDKLTGVKGAGVRRLGRLTKLERVVRRNLRKHTPAFSSLDLLTAQQ